MTLRRGDCRERRRV